jgi:hypothetical protein
MAEGYGQVSDEEEQVAASRGRSIDRMQSLRNKLVTVVQEHPDEAIKAKARARLAELPKYDPGATEELEPSMDSMAPKKNAPIMGSTTPIRDAASAIGNKGASMLERIGVPVVNMGHAASTVLSQPDKMINDPAYRVNALRAIDKGYLFGAGSKLGEMVEPERVAQAQKQPLDPQVQSGLEAIGTMAPGGLASKAAGLAERGLTAVPGLGRLLARAPKTGGALVGAGGAAAGGGAQAAGQTLTSGGSVGEAGRAAVSAATDPANLALGATGGAIQGAGAGMRANNPDVQFLEQRGGRVSLRDPGSGGAMNSPMVQAGFENVPGPLGGQSRKVTEAGKGVVQRRAADATADALEGRARGARETHMQAEAGAAASGALNARVDRRAVFNEAQRMIDDPRTPEAVKSAIQREVMGGFFDEVSPQPRPSGLLGPDGAPVPAPPRDFSMSIAQANDLKQKIQDAAKFVPEGAPGAAKPHFARLSHEASQGLGPMGEINARSHAQFDQIEDARAALGIPGSARKPITEAQRNTLGNTLGRRGADTRSAGKDVKPELETVLQNFPELRPFIEAPELLQHRANLEFGVGIGGGPVNKREMLHTLLRNMGPAQARVLSPALETIGRQLRAFAPATASFMPENLGEGERRRMDQR